MSMAWGPDAVDWLAALDWDGFPHREVFSLWPAITRDRGRSEVHDFVPQPRPTGKTGYCRACC